MLLDIETNMTQIVGRIRFNEKFKNVFRHKVYHIFSTNKNIMTDEEFNQYINDKREESQLIYNELISKDEDVRRIFIERMNFESDFISKKGNMIYLNDKKEQC